MTIHAPGDLIADRYEVRAYIGAGGMQEVYRAEDLILKRDVALKAPKNESAERRFKRSATLSAMVNHPNAAKTLDYVEVGIRPYLVEEFIMGEDLSKARGRLRLMDPYLVAHVLHHLARGIAASHHVGVVHRDLKPSNIMVAPDLSFGFVKITDFGIAKMAEEELTSAAEGGEESISGSYTMMGALPYMAPEMIESPRTTGKPADVWAVAAISYELLSGEKPFGKGLKAVKNIVEGPFPPAPSLIAKTQFQGLGSELYELIKRCCEKDPVARPTADQLVEQCGRLCYPLTARLQGTVNSMPYGSYGFIAGPNGNVFFHQESVYGANPAVGDLVYFAAFPGDPHPRAHPVVKMVAAE